MKRKDEHYKKLVQLIKSLLMSNTVTYPNEKNFDHADNRPYAEVLIYGNNGKKKRLFCLVDTGADDIQIHEDIATELDIDLNTEATVDTIETASGGQSQVYTVPNIKMEVEGATINEDLIFGSNSIPLIGRRTILTAYEIGFKPTKWLF
ncbi:MAG: retropepsin-like aspartic protease [Ferruginibacter sp.]